MTALAATGAPAAVTLRPALELPQCETIAEDESEPAQEQPARVRGEGGGGTPAPNGWRGRGPLGVIRHGAALPEVAAPGHCASESPRSEVARARPGGSPRTTRGPPRLVA